VPGKGEPSPRDPEVAVLAEALRERVFDLADDMAKSILDSVEVYRNAQVVTAGELSDSCRAHIEFVLTSVAGGDVDASAAQATGRRRAEQGVPLPALMSAYRIGSKFLWDTIAAAAEGSGVSPVALVRAASDIWELQTVYTEAMSASYRDVISSHIRAREQERSALVEALLEGRAVEHITVWEVADLLHLPHQGPYVVVAAEVPEVGQQALAGIEERLLGVGLSSAWRLLPDRQIGIVSFHDKARLHLVVDQLRRRATRRVGVSPPYNELADTGKALRLARIALMGSTSDERVTVFDEAPLSVAAVGAPEVMGRVVQNVLGGLAALPRDDRTVLLDTFKVWLDCGGSATDAAEKLFCHPNTVRYRLRRIEERTGRSLTEPRAVAELCLAFEAQRRLG
jgi:hypothetical protein